MSTPFLNLDGTPLSDPVLGYGGTGVVVRRDGAAVKLPLKYIGDSDDDTQANLQVIRHEADVYRRLRDCDGVVRCFDVPGDCIQMELTENGDLSAYIKGHRPLQSAQLSWFRQMAHSLVHIHDRCVIVADIATKNILLSADFSIKFCDFTESSILPLGTDMERIDDHGYSIYTDMGQLGAVMYEVITGHRCEFDLFKDQPPGPACAAWPRREILPPTQNIWLGSIIEKCWVKNAFQNARSLLTALELVTLDCPLEHERKIYERLGSHANVLAEFEISAHLSHLQDRALDKCLSQAKLNRTQQLNWMQEAATAVSYAHSKRVLIGGFTARSFLIADGQTLKLCDFGNSRVVPEHLDIGEINEDSLSFKHDISCFGSLLYNVVTGGKFEACICQLSNSSTRCPVAVSENEYYTIPSRMAKSRHIHLPNCPQDRELPNTEGIFMGNIIRDCWAQSGYMRMEDVCSALSELSKQDCSVLTGKTEFRLLHRCFVPMLAAAAGSLVFIAFRRGFYKASRPGL